MFEMWQIIGMGLAGILIGFGSAVKVLFKKDDKSERDLEEYLEHRLEKMMDEKLKHHQEKQDLRLSHIEEGQKSISDSMKSIHGRISEVKGQVTESKIAYLEELAAIKNSNKG